MGTETAVPTKEKHMGTENTPTVFTFGTANLVAVTDETGQSWFRANEICEILGYANPRQAVKKNCKPKGVSTRDTLTEGGLQSATYISEGNLYRLIIKSKKPDAEAFEDWVMEEVLPSIRKTGGYYMTITREQYLDWFDGYLHGPMTLRLEAQKAADEKEKLRLQNVQKRLDAKLEVNNLKERITILERQIDRLRDGGLKVKEQYEILLRGKRYAYLDFHYLD